VFNRRLGAPKEGPVGIAQIQCPAHVCGGSSVDISDHPTYKRIIPATIAKTVHDILTTVVSSGTGTNAAMPGVDVAGKTGTTSNYGDAWFVGWTPQLTVAVWVGFPTKLVSMATMYNGSPVEGGTYPAIIWQNFMTQALQILANEQAAKGQSPSNSSGSSASSAASGSGASSGTSSTPTQSNASPAGAGTGGGTTGGNSGTGGTGGGGGVTAGGGNPAGGGGAGTGGAGTTGGGGTGSRGRTGSGGGGGTGGGTGSGGGGGGAGLGGGGSSH